jgi:hypothetical protein
MATKQKNSVNLQLGTPSIKARLLALNQLTVRNITASYITNVSQINILNIFYQQI